MTEPIVILAGGGERLPTRPLPHPRWVIAADSGVHLADTLSLHVDLVVGDLDSARPDAIARAVAGGAEVERHDPDKDATDLELALEAARRAGGGRVIVVGGIGGDRLDHLLAAAGLVGSGRFADLDLEWWDGPSRAVVTREKVEIDGARGDLLSIVPIAGPVTVTCSGVRWPLDGDTLEHGSTRGVSNELLDADAVVEIADGSAFIVHTLSARGAEPDASARPKEENAGAEPTPKRSQRPRRRP